jgi:hypothetical protein
MSKHKAHGSKTKEHHDPNKWYVHDEGKVTFVWDMVDKCEALSQSFSYMRLGLYYRTKMGMQAFCHVHLMWPTNIDPVDKEAWYTAPGDSARTMSTTRNPQDVVAWTNRDEGIIYDAAGRPIMDPQQGYSENLDVQNGGYAVWFGDPRPDAELKQKAKEIHLGMRKYGTRIGHARNLECWLLGPVSLLPGQELKGSIVVKLRGRFEEGTSYQHCTLWQSHYCQDGNVSDGTRPDDTNRYYEGELQTSFEGAASDEINMLRANLFECYLPPYAHGAAWKLEQYKRGRTECQAKSMLG